jgi:hypothetical protein
MPGGIFIKALPAAEGSVYEPPAAPHCREARERACLRGEENGWEKRKVLNLPAVKTSCSN